MEYHDFTIDIRSADGGRFEATVVDAPFRENPRIYFPPPLEATKLKTLLEIRDKLGDLPAELSPRVVGRMLYSALFQGDLAHLFERCRAAFARDDNAGLRLRLKFLLNDTEARFLAELPWEWLWDPRLSTFLSTDLKTPVVRDFATRHIQVNTLESASPIRILVVDPAPSDLHGVSAGEEITRMKEELGQLVKAGQIELLQLEESTAEALRHALRDQGIHVLHFMGHGGYDEDSGFGAVFFTRPDGTKDQVDGQQLADSLKTIPELRLVVLNACTTARHAGHAGAPLNYGAASAVLEWAGVPAVIANQHPISNAIAPCISRIFYRRLAEGDDVEGALTEVRRQLQKRSSEWATPVLFLAARRGKLFGAKPGPGQGRQGVRVLHPSRTVVEPVRLGVRSIVGYGADMEERNDDVLDLVKHFDGRPIRNQKDWQEIIFPELRDFLQRKLDPHRPLLLDFAAHSSIAFAAGWLLEAKSGLDVQVIQRTSAVGTLPWAPDDGTAGEDRLWLDQPDIEVVPGAPDVALALAVSQPGVAAHVEAFVQNPEKKLAVGRIIDATIATGPGPQSVRGGAHSLRLAQTLLPRLRRRYPHERTGKLHLFCSGPNALLFYMGQLSRSLDSIVLYEFAFGMKGSFGRYQPSIELPPPGESRAIPDGW